MKLNFIFLVPICCLTSFVTAQSESEGSDVPKEDIITSVNKDSSKVKISCFFYVSDSPEFPGGDDGVIKFIKEHLVYPEEANKANIQGTCVVDFIINENGSLSDFKLRKDIGHGCGEEALRVAKLIPKWQPARNNGMPVKVEMKIPIRFKPSN